MNCTPVENNGRHGYGKGRHAPKEFKCDLSAVTMPWRSVVFNGSANHCILQYILYPDSLQLKLLVALLEEDLSTLKEGYNKRLVVQLPTGV